MVDEGCLTGFGKREIIRFTTRFRNVGELDYYIGEPSLENFQFTFDNCHNHFHYDNYAEYLLFNEEGAVIPSGFKSGFCLIDLNCEDGNNKYGCSNMGLTIGCFDEYSSDLDCQWIDVTDIPDGNLIFVARVNWGNQPDALGRVEKNLLNNWAQVCLNLDRSSGKLEVTLIEDCSILADCEGRPYGDQVTDCKGSCGGKALRGDLDENQLQDMQDVLTYVSVVLEDEMQATACNDLNGDNKLTVYDAALLADCMNFGAGHVHDSQGLHDHCDFPGGIVNILDTVSLRITSIDKDQKYVDIALKNAHSGVVAFQFKLNGLEIISLENRIDIKEYPALLQANIATGMVIGISLQDSTIQKSRDWQPLIRVHYARLTDDFLCLDEQVDIIDEYYHQVMAQISEPCLDLISNASIVRQEQKIAITPNPFTQSTVLSFFNPYLHPYTLNITDLSGKVLHTYNNIRTDQIVIDQPVFGKGVYLFYLTGDRVKYTGKLVIH